MAGRKTKLNTEVIAAISNDMKLQLSIAAALTDYKK